MTIVKHDGILLPCPFCGGKAIMESWEMVPFEKMHIPEADGYWYRVFCDSCGSYGPDCISAKEAAESWNKRVQ